jgi:hypothetical protein
MSHRPRSARLLVSIVSLGLVVACSIFTPGTPGAGETPAAPEPTVIGPTETGPVEGGPAPEPRVVAQQGETFNIYSLDGALLETRSAAGLGFSRPNTAQVVGETIYYVDSGGSSLGGVVRRVDAAGPSALDFTAAEEMAALSFAVSPDESRIAWTHSTWGEAGVTSQLYIANIDGSNTQMIVHSDPNDDLEEFYALEAVRWTTGGDLIYSWQVTGIGGYILFFGWSSFYRYGPATGASTPLVAASASGTGPCWYTLSPDEGYAVGGCGADGMGERELASGVDTTFPVLPDQGQDGAAAYSPSGARLAYAIARGEFENEAGQVVLRLARGEAPAVIASHSPGYFDAIQWVDEERMVVAYTVGDGSAVDLLEIDGARSPIGHGRLTGLMRPAVAAAGAGEGLAGMVDRGEVTVEDITSSGDIAGPGIDVVVGNPGPEPVEVIIPCGFTFMPDNSGDQRLMVVQEASASIPAGGQASLNAYVVCIDSNNDAPSEGAGYSLGTMQTGDLLRLAQCVCGEDLVASQDPFAGMGVMTAGWMISNGQSFSDMVSSEAEGAMDQFFGEGSAGAFAGFLSFLEDPANAWLDRCGISLP